MTLCRTCLSEEATHCLFDSLSEHDETPQVAEAVMALASVQIQPNDGLSSNICSNCLLELKEAYVFKSKCERADLILRREKLNTNENVCVKIEFECSESKESISIITENINIKEEVETSSLEKIPPNDMTIIKFENDIDLECTNENTLNDANSDVTELNLESIESQHDGKLESSLSQSVSCEEQNSNLELFHSKIKNSLALFKAKLDLITSNKELIQNIWDGGEALEFLQIHNIMPKVQICDNGHVMKTPPCGELYWQCMRRSCRKRKGIRKGTLLENSKIPLQTIVHFIYCWSREMTSIKFCTEDLGMSQPTVVEWNNYLREVCVWRISQNTDQIGGKGLYVEIDESVLMRRKDKAGKIFPQQWVFGGICRQSKECFIVQVPDCSANTIIPIINEKIRPGSIIISDYWETYAKIGNGGLPHQTVAHEINFVNPANAHKLEHMWGSVNWGNKKRIGKNRNFLDSYLAEFMWRTMLNDRDPFNVILEDIASFWKHRDHSSRAEFGWRTDRRGCRRGRKCYHPV